MTLRIIASGCCGRMGRVLSGHISRREGCRIVAGIDSAAQKYYDYPVYGDFESCDVSADVIVDFSSPSALEPLLKYAASRDMPLVIATTGYLPEQAEAIKEASGKIPVFYTANMSLGINLLVELAKTAARVLGDGFDIEIVEKHHNRKIDAPSGTAHMIANAVSKALLHESRPVYGRGRESGKRAKGDIGIHAVRGGTITGEHEIIFAGQDEVVTLGHHASSPEIFAAGAVNAAFFIYGKQPGLFSMADLTGGRN